MSKNIIPIPPKNSEVLKTPCEFCIVGCGYVAYKWQYGKDGTEKNNIFDKDFSKQQEAYGKWISVNQHQVVRDKNGKKYNLAIIPDDDCFVNKGLNSIRGGTSAVKCYSIDKKISDNRLLNPLIYNSGKYLENNWNDSVEIISKVTKHLLDSKGSDSITMKFFDHGMGGGGFENNWAVGKFFFTGIGTQMSSIHNRPAYNSEVFAAGDAGTAGLNSNYFELEIADTIVLIGCNSFETQTNAWWAHIVPNLSGNTFEDKKNQYLKNETYDKAKLVIIDPRRTPTVSSAEDISKENVLHLSPEPGTDVVLINSISRVIYENNWHDQNFINKYSDNKSWEEYKIKSLEISKSLNDILENAVKITGVNKKDILKAAEWIAKPKIGNFKKRTFIGYEKGIIWGLNNYHNVGSIISLSLLTDNCATRPGTACTRMGGHQEGYVRPPYPGKRPGKYIDEELEKGNGNLFWIGGCDPVNTTLDAGRMRKVLEKRGKLVKDELDKVKNNSINDKVQAIIKGIEKGGLFVIVQNIYFIKSAEYSHIVLPAAKWGEHWATTMNGERRIRLYEKLYDPPGNAKPDYEIMALIANRIKKLYEMENNYEMAKRFSGFDWIEQDNKSNAEKCFIQAGESAFPNPKQNGLKPIEAYRGLNYSYLKKLGNNGIILPVSLNKNELTGIYGLNDENKNLLGTRLLHENYEFYGGKAKFISAVWKGFPEKVQKQKNKYKFWINNGRSNHVWQTSYYESRIDFFKNKIENPYIEINSKDAKSLNIISGDEVRVKNDYGEVKALAYITDGVKQNHAFMVFANPRGAVNLLVTDYVEKETNIPYYKGTWADISKVSSSKKTNISYKDTRKF